MRIVLKRAHLETGLWAQMGFLERRMHLVASENDQERLIRAWGDGLTAPVELTLMRSDDQRTASLYEFCHRLRQYAPAVTVREVTADEAHIPAILIRDYWTIHMAPEGRELAPFLDLLTKVAAGDGGFSPELKKMLEAVSVPSLLDVFVSTQCPVCQGVVDAIVPFPLANPCISVRVTDGILFREKAEERSVRAVPTVFTADGIRFTGPARAEDVADALLKGDPARMSSEAFARMIQAGDAEGLAEMMLDSEQVFPGVLDLLAGEAFSLRLGAMVAMETVAERNADLAREILEPLWGRMKTANPSAVGDIVYLIGEYGDTGWKARLTDVIESSHESDLIEAAKDALRSLEERGKP